MIKPKTIRYVYEAEAITGGLSKPSKMPGHAYNLPPQRCGVGSKFHDKAGSICSFCYGWDRGRYVFPNVKEAMERRYQTLRHPQWVEAMTLLVRRDDWFRWHDVGDIQDVEHLENIVQVARNTPDTRHWLPTREYKIVRTWVEQGNSFPDNLCVRFSAMFFDQPAPVELAKRWGATASAAGTPKGDTFVCPAPKQDNQCGKCRACWFKPSVTYKKH